MDDVKNDIDAFLYYYFEWRKNQYQKRNNTEYNILPLNADNFPTVSDRELVFETKDGMTLHGKYKFNEYNQRRWIDNDGNEYTSDMIVRWGYN